MPVPQAKRTCSSKQHRKPQTLKKHLSVRKGWERKKRLNASKKVKITYRVINCVLNPSQAESTNACHPHKPGHCNHVQQLGLLIFPTLVEIPTVVNRCTDVLCSPQVPRMQYLIKQTDCFTL